MCVTLGKTGFDIWLVLTLLDNPSYIFYTNDMTTGNNESDGLPEKEQRATAPKTEWHLLFAVEQDLALTPVGVGVEAEFAVMKDSPKIDLLLLRRTGDQWTDTQRARLPDGVRDSTSVNNLLEFKYTESLTLQAITQGLGYEHFFRTTRHLSRDEVSLFILIAKTPSVKRVTELGFAPTALPGVLRGENIYVRHVIVLLLNELRDVPHNALVKTFASRQAEKRKAFKALDGLDDLPGNLVTYLQGLRTIWSLPKGEAMNEIMTPEWVMEVGEAWKRTLMASMTPEELDAYLPGYKQKILEQGILSAKRETVRAMIARNFDVAVIADVTGLTIEQVNAFLLDGSGNIG